MKSITAVEFKKNYHGKDKLIVIDVRSLAEFKSQSLRGASNIPIDMLNCVLVENHLKDNDSSGDTVYLLCKSGQRSKMASEKLAGLAQAPVCVEGGMDALIREGGLDIFILD